MFRIDKNKITFSHQYDEPISKHLIEVIKNNNITEVVFGWDFRQNIDNLPSSIKTIIFCSYYFDLPIDSLPYSLETLKLSKFFDNPLDNLPEALQTIYFGEHFNKPIDNLPLKLKNIYFPITGHFNHTLANLPDSLEILVLPRNYRKKISYVPKNINRIRVHRTYPHYEEFRKTLIKKGVLDYYDL